MKNKVYFVIIALILIVVPITSKAAVAFTGYVKITHEFSSNDLYYFKKNSNTGKYDSANPYQVNSYSFKFNKSDSVSYLAFCVKPGYGAHILSNEGYNAVKCEPINYSSYCYSGIAKLVGNSTVDIFQKIANGELTYHGMESIDKFKYDFIFRIAGLSGFRASTTNDNYNSMWNTKYKFEGKQNDNTLPKIVFAGGTVGSTYLEAGNYPYRYFNPYDPYEQSHTNLYGEHETSFRMVESAYRNLITNAKPVTRTTTESGAIVSATGYGTSDTQTGRQYKITAQADPELEQKREEYMRLYNRWFSVKDEQDPSPEKEYLRGQIMRLGNEIKRTPIKLYVSRNDGTSTSNPPNLSELNGERSVWDWHGRDGFLTITPSPTKCWISFNLSAELSSGSSEKAFYYCANLEGPENQDFLVYAPKTVDTDKFMFKTTCLPGISHEEEEDEIEIEERRCEPTLLPTEPHEEFDIHNCCDDAKPTTIRQRELDELFCTWITTTINVNFAAPRENAEKYETTEGTNSYCKQYCGSTIQYTPPVPTKAIADRSFVFAKNPYSISGENFVGPELYQFKRCRTVIDFDLWFNQYKSQAQSLVTKYNAYQNNMAKYYVWSDAITHKQKETFTITCTCTKTTSVGYTSTSKSYDTLSTKLSNTRSTSISSWVTTAYSSSTGTYTITESESKTKNYDIYTYNLSPYIPTRVYPKLKVITDRQTYLKYADDGTHRVSFGNGSAEGDKENESSTLKFSDKSEVDAAMTDAQTYVLTSACSAAESSVSTDYSNLSNSYGSDGGYPKIEYNKSSSPSISTSGTPECHFNYIDDPVNAESTRDGYYGYATTYRESYNSNLSQFTTLESALNKCGGDLSTNSAQSIIDRVKFKSEPELVFTYKYAFLDDANKIQDQVIKIDFEKTNGGKCVQEFKTSFNSDPPGTTKWSELWELKGWQEQQYDNRTYGNGNMSMYHMNKIDANALDSAGTSHQSGSYTASKKFTTDAAGLMECRWTDTTQTEYTVVPYGVIEKDVKVVSSTGINNGNTIKLHKVVKTHASGKFETYFTLKNVADGTFDKILSEAGSTCSGYNGKDSEGNLVNLSCYLEVDQEGSELLDCSKDGIYNYGSSTTTACKPVVAKMYLDYKEVDPSQLFPNTVSYGWNWKSSQEGPTVLAKIQDDAAADRTYSPDNLTYSFTLTPNDLKAIKEYNKSRVNYGGYTDFNMDCTLNGNAYVKCKSKFLTAISGGQSVPSDNGKSLALSTSNVNIQEVRNNW
ncbi:MAG: hypothetical protein K5666_00065 [Bacilli bacterium]|nr:hypothetical protein [Bacilli bacterium]